DGYIYGYGLTKMNIPFETTDEMAAMAQDMFEPFPANDYPNLAE
ncbi:MAG TPA: TetR family transcriptional regulator, partial [Arthrobacter bacterium]|nr:TetR family transcriptional regulator [Arthrobacter sp.]